MQICLMGGTFDPPHWGHLLLAEILRDSHSIQQIIFIPAYIPPHKQDADISSPDHRLEMLSLICKGNPYFEVDPREIDRKGVSYTIDTVREIKEEQGLTRKDIGLFIGADNLIELDSWKQADELVRECTVLVAARPNAPIDGKTPYRNAVQFLDLPEIEISGSDIRTRMKAGKSIKYQVLPAVEEYITKNNLYVDG
ncbi:MAG: nicotinate (nicotinamide) nucleotide adenylyltransferase [Candidatus Marinimicrobia bacterium]|nr:nicotinate (nicotinamide) nucleotide adenylyltransferase [Candidatus Neomarinimicrobiota bacterium]MCF7827701.1 nicotinate (nicotinamide) nucleotide adenylyltransferase [Candidatus Neomarinimicrobiota bacterium]MCF7881244.1 nicotinate (nicotinamide) nucleotide adenylyltransferase [Candidatus Neomarinimicrobiota bacterium]